MIDDLLSPGRIESLPPEPEGVETAWREVTRRRRARTLRSQVAAGVALVVVVMVGLLPSLDEEGRVANLDVADRSGADRGDVAPPDRGESLVDESAEPPRGQTGEGSGPRAGGAQPPAPAVEGPAPIRPGGEAPTPGRTKPPMEREQYETLSVGCVDWCMHAIATEGANEYTLGLGLCVAVGGRARRFSFDTTQELDIWITTDGVPGERVWTWSAGQRFSPFPHHLDLYSGECVNWTTAWDLTDESGEPVPPGRYRLFVKSLAEQAADYPVSEASFQITE